jgi:Tol biopolymer transport system component
LFSEPAISPDGLRIAYSSLTDLVTVYDIYTIPADGGFPVRAGGSSDQDGMPAWTPASGLIWSSGGDGSALATRDSVSVAGLRAVGLRVGGTFVIHVYRGAEVVARVNADPGTALVAPAFSPDGNELAWIRVWDPDTVATRMDVVVGGPDGSQAETIVAVSLPGGLMRWSGGNNFSLAWSPDGRRLAFNRPESSTTGHVFVVSRDGGPPTQITSAPGAGDRSVSWSYLPRP